MNWNDWYKHYDNLPSLQERLRLVREQIVAAVSACPPGRVRIISICAGDGRDLIGALQNHPRREDVSAVLLDNHAESIARGSATAERAGLGRQFRFVEADATQAKNYAGIVPADLLVLSGFLGHLRQEDIPGLIGSLPMFCKTGGEVIWSRHLVMNKGRELMPQIRKLLQQTQFNELDFATTGPEGFAVGRVRFNGQTVPLDENRVLFEFVGLDRLLSVALPSPAGRLTIKTAPAQVNGTTGDEVLAGMTPTIPYRFGRMVLQHPKWIALGSETWRPTYEELDAASNRLAHAIIARGGATGDRVGLLLRHDSPLIACALAVLKTGRIVLVLNPTEPVDRLRKILQDAEPGLIVTDRTNHELAGQLAGTNHSVICFEDQTSGPTHAPGIEVKPDDVAWLIYTSGSTGVPKGVMQTQRNMVHNALRLSLGMQISAMDKVILLGFPSGGQGIATIWCALLNGSAICPYPISENGVVGLKNWMTEHQITVWVSSSSVFRHFVKNLADADRLPDMRLVRFGSETATAGDFAAFRKHFSDKCVVLNSLSSSETGNITQHFLTHASNINGGRLPVGRPAAGMEVLLWDENGEEVHEGEVGEIIVRSRYLSPGYWRNESLTGERFFGDAGPDHFRLYRTGDFGRRAPDGALTFMDRKDDRVKIQGYRVELSEIEEALNQLAEVENTLVLARAAANGDNQLSAYVVLRPGQTGAADEMRRQLRASLPTYMVPANFIFLDEFPLTAHGKIDRQALPLPQPPAPRERSANYLKPRDVVERNLAKIWESVLGVSPIGRRDDFFNLGGTSLQSVEAMVAIEEIFEVALPPSTLVTHNTIESLAPLLSGHAIIPSPSPLVVLHEGGDGRPLFFIHSGQGDVVTYGLLARRLPGRPIYGLQAVGIQGEAWPLMSVHDMAERYLPLIIAKDPTGPYQLAGTCMGGMVAYELAQRLVAMGRTVRLLALLDAPTAPYSGNRPRWHEATMDPLRDALRMLRWGIIRASGFKADVRRLPAYRRFVAGMTNRANRRYHPAPYPGTVTLFLTTDTKYKIGDRREVISRFARTTRKFMIPGKRPELFLRPAVDELAGHLQACLESAETNPVTETRSSSAPVSSR